MGRPPIGKKAMSSSERAQRHRNKKRQLAQFNKVAIQQREGSVLETLLWGPTNESSDKWFRMGWALGVQSAKAVARSWEFISRFYPRKGF
jgi:hypothetical protein